MMYSPATSHRFGQHYASSVNSLEDSFQVHPPCDLSYQYRGYPFWSKFLVNTKEVNFNHQDSPWERERECKFVTKWVALVRHTWDLLQDYNTLWLPVTMVYKYRFRTTKLKDIQGFFTTQNYFLLLRIDRLWNRTVSSPKVPKILYDENTT